MVKYNTHSAIEKYFLMAGKHPFEIYNEYDEEEKRSN